MILFKKALSLYQETAALLVVLIVLTASVLYVLIGGIRGPSEQLQTTNSLVPPPYTKGGGEKLAFVAGSGECDVASFSIDSEEQAVFNLINQHRVNHGLAHLVFDSTLNRMAQWTAEDMAKISAQSIQAHTDSLGRVPEQRAGSCGVNGWNGETLYAGQANGQATFIAWLNSPQHNSVLLNPSYKSIGIGRATVSGSQFTNYWAAEFGLNDGDGTGGEEDAGTGGGGGGAGGQNKCDAFGGKAGCDAWCKSTAPFPDGGNAGPNSYCNNACTECLGRSAGGGPINEFPNGNTPPGGGGNNQIDLTCDQGAQMTGYSNFAEVCAGYNLCVVTPPAGEQCACGSCSPRPPTTTPTLTPTPTATPTVVPNETKIALELWIPSIGPDVQSGQNNNPLRTSRRVEVQVFNLSGQKIKETTGTLTFNANKYTFIGDVLLGADFQSGAYIVKVRFDNTLRKAISAQLTQGQTVSLPSVQLTAGDINWDNVLDLSDYNALLSCYGPRQCDQKERADLNLDGIVDERDLNIFLSGLAKRHGD